MFNLSCKDAFAHFMDDGEQATEDFICSSQWREKLVLIFFALYYKQELWVVMIHLPWESKER